MPNILEVKSVQAHSFKVLFEALKELLDDCNITFDETGMRILAIDGSHVCLVHMKLEAGNFAKYFCKEPKIVGVNISYLHKLLRQVSQNDTLTFFIDSDIPHELGICIENADQNSVTNYLYKMLEIDEKEMQVPKVEFSVAMTMPSLEFQNLCRYLKDLSEDIEITCINNQLIITLDGDNTTMKR
jgi:proliferating cell nuclear antigen